MELSKEDSKKLEKYFETRKLYVRLVLIGVGIVIIVYLFKRMKMEYIN
jgi:hypothetical protein